MSTKVLLLTSFYCLTGNRLCVDVILKNSCHIICYMTYYNEFTSYITDYTGTRIGVKSYHKQQLKNVTELSEDEFFQYSLSADLDLCNIRLLKSIQTASLDYFKNERFLFESLKIENIEYEY